MTHQQAPAWTTSSFYAESGIVKCVTGLLRYGVHSCNASDTVRAAVFVIGEVCSPHRTRIVKIVYSFVVTSC